MKSIKNIKNIKQTTTALAVFGLLTYILFNSNDLLTRVVIIPFIIFSLGLFFKNICLILEKTKLAKLMEKIYVIAFFVYYFGFLIYWDYISITNKDYVSLVVSFLAWFGGLFVAYKRYLKLKSK